MQLQQRVQQEQGPLFATSSARLNRCAEDVRIQALVIPKLKFVDVQMQILLADFMEGADDPTFYDGPESFDGVGMNRSTHIKRGIIAKIKPISIVSVTMTS